MLYLRKSHNILSHIGSACKKITYTGTIDKEAIMINLQYELHYFDNPDYPIIFHDNHLVKNLSYIRNHWHINIELLFIKFGIVELDIDGVISYAEKGDIVVINSNAIHSIRPYTEEVFYYCLIIDYRYCADIGFDTNSTVYKKINNDPEMKNIYQLIINESYQVKPHYKKAIRALCHTMLILLDRNQVDSRNISQHLELKNRSGNIDTTKSVIEFIHQNFAHSFSLDLIAQHIAISKYHMCRIFKEITGITINAYTNQFRLEKARTLLIDEDLTISEVSELTGFNSLSYFTKTFRSHFGYPPSHSKYQSKLEEKDRCKKKPISTSITDFQTLVEKYL